MSRVGVVVIGRNEGQRLAACLRSVAGSGYPLVYLDSGSSDDSVPLARGMGAQVVELDASAPLCAARARNAGFERLMNLAPDVQFVQFVDGDCEVAAGWIEHAEAQLAGHEHVAVVCGRRRERFMQRSVYNRLADLEWDTPIGEAQSCGGDAMMRTAALAAVGGFDASIAAGEEPELCQRLRQAGWKVLRIDGEMTLHDSAMTHFGQWWRRAVRSGYGAMDVFTRFGQHGLFAKQVRSVRVWAIAWPCAVVAAGLLVGWRFGAVWGVLAAGIVAIALPMQVLRLTMSVCRRTESFGDALAYGMLTMISKWAGLVGQVRYIRDRLSGRNTRLIEYKPSAPQQLIPSPGIPGEGRVGVWPRNSKSEA